MGGFENLLELPASASVGNVKKREQTSAVAFCINTAAVPAIRSRKRSLQRFGKARTERLLYFLEWKVSPSFIVDAGNAASRTMTGNHLSLEFGVVCDEDRAMLKKSAG